MIKDHLVDKTMYSFVVIATGSTDITTLTTESESVVTMYEQVKSHTGILCDTVQAIAQEMDMDVFLVENPPRYDPTVADSLSIKQKVNKYSNSLLSTTLGLAPRVFIVEQGSLARSSVKARNDLYQADDVHLTTRGLFYHSSNLITAMQDTYEDTKLIKPAEDGRGGANGGSPGRNRGRGFDNRQRDNRGQGGWRQQNRGERYREQPSDNYSDNRGWRGGQGRRDWDREQRQPRHDRGRGGGRREWEYDEYQRNDNSGERGYNRNR